MQVRPSAIALTPLLLFLALFFGAGLYFTAQGEPMGFYQLRAPVAILPALALASAASMVPMLLFSLALGDEAMRAWGWRLPFFVAAPLGISGMYLRSKMEDTPVFRELAENSEPEASVPLKELFVDYWKPLLLLGGLGTDVGGADDRAE